MRKILFILMMLTVSAVVEAQTPFRGVDFTMLHLSPVDSALLRMNSVMYSGWDTYGEVTSSKSTIYGKWAKNYERYYPVMRESWKYCLDHAPYQVRLYKEGVKFYQFMIQGAGEDSVKRVKYGKELMALYDLHIQNLDSINAHVKRISDKSSKGNMMLRKASTYEYFVLGQAKQGEEYYSTQRKAVMYPMYKDAVNMIKKTFDEGTDNGGDVDITALKTYFVYAFYNYVDTFNAHLQNDSVNKKIRADAKNVLLTEYNFMRDFCDRQVQDLGADYVDTLSVDGTDSLDVVLRNVVAPYKDLMAFCDQNMQGAGISVAIQTLEDAWAEYTNDLNSHKDSLAWLNRIKVLCESTIDFSPDNEYYFFYEQVDKLRSAALEKAMANAKDAATQRQMKKYETNEYETRARAAMNSLRGRRMDPTTAKTIALVIYYLNRAIATNPGRASVYQSWKNSYINQAGFRGELMMAGVMEGQTITVNGVTFKVSLR